MSLVSLPVPARPRARRAPVALGRAIPAAATHSVGFGLLLVVTATLFVRPAELVPDLVGWPIYQTLIITCLAVSFAGVLRQLNGRSLSAHPVTACVLGLLAAVALSQLAHARLEEAAQSAWEFFKVVVYYLLLVGLLSSAGRLRGFLFFFAVSVSVLTAVAVLQFHGAINIPNLTALSDRATDAATGLTVLIPRLRSTGLFGDPNDLCLIIVAGLPVSLYWLTDRRLGPARYLWAGPTALLGHALFLTQSRGGFLAFLIGLLVFLWTRYGWKRAALLAAVALPAALALFAGRQTDLSAKEDTGLQRVQLWSDALTALREYPLFGAGYDKFKDEAGLVAHNSYLHCYAELGVLGGTLFVGAFALALASLARLGAKGLRVLDPELHRLRPYLFATAAGYAAGILSLSNSYTVPTYLMLGLTVAYADLARTAPALAPARLDGRLVARLALGSLAFLGVAYLFVRVFVRW